jgi:hypothetical protein
MNYLMMITSDYVHNSERNATMRREIPKWIDEGDARGRKFGFPLKHPNEGVSVQVRDGATLVTDGPFVETKEFLGGFDVIDCANLDEAIELAAKHPSSWYHTIEVRPFFEAGPELPSKVDPPAAGRQRYLLLIYVDGVPEPNGEDAEIMREGLAWGEAVTASGHQVFGHALHGLDTATSVRVRNGETVLTDGPFVETKEFIAGFDILDCTSLEEATALAAKHPIARYHHIEVRPFESEDAEPDSSGR